MPRFEYITQTTKGAPFIRGSAEAPSLVDLHLRLARLNKPIVRVSEVAARSQGGRKARIPFRSKLQFIEQLEACSSLGMDLRTALTICYQTTSQRTKKGQRVACLIADLRDRVSRGQAFAQAIRSYPEIFDEVATGLIVAGEEGGIFGEALSNVRKIWSRDDELRHRLGTMMVYPLIVTAVAFGVVWLLLARVVPQFIQILSEMDVALPLPTRMLLFLSEVTSHYPVLLLGLGAAGFIALIRLPSWVRKHAFLHQYVLRLPLIGSLCVLLMRATFSRTFAQLKHAKAKTTDALVLCRDLSWNYHYRAAVARCVVRVQNGGSLSSALAEDVDIFGEMVVSGMAFMEMAGADSAGLFRLTNLLERQLDARLFLVRTVLDPILIIFLGVVIGGIVFATFLPAIEILHKI